MPLNQKKKLSWARIGFPMWICFFRREICCIFHLPSFEFPKRIGLILTYATCGRKSDSNLFLLQVTLHCCSQDATVLQSYFFLQEAAPHFVSVCLLFSCQLLLKVFSHPGSRTLTLLPRKDLIVSSYLFVKHNLQCLMQFFFFLIWKRQWLACLLTPSVNRRLTLHSQFLSSILLISL